MRFKLALQLDAGQGAARKVARVNAHHDAGIGIALVARILAHAVGHDAARFGRGRHHRAARAHAKAVHRAAIAGMVHQFVFGRAQRRIASMSAPAGAVDQSLRMLDAKADGKRLGLDVDAALVQHGKGVARTVAQRQHDLIGAQLMRLASGLVEHREAANVFFISAPLDQYVGHALLKADFAAQRNDLLTQVFHHLDELEGANVRMRFKKDVSWRTGLDKFDHHLAAQVARVLDLAVELTVRKRAGAAFAKLNIRFGIEHIFSPQAPGVLGALANGLAALQHDGPKTHLRQHQGSEHAAGTKTDDHRAQRQTGRCAADRVVGHVGRGEDVRVAGVPGQQRGFQRDAAEHHIDDVDLHDLGLARVKAALEDCETRQVCERDFQCVEDGILQRVVGVRERKFDFGQSEHGRPVRGLWLSSRTGDFKGLWIAFR